MSCKYGNNSKRNYSNKYRRISAAEITLALHDNSENSAKAFVSTKEVAQKNFLRIDTANIYLEASDKIQAQASANNDLHLFLFLEEYYDPTR